MASVNFEAYHAEWLEIGKAHLKAFRNVLEQTSDEEIKDLVQRCHAFYNSYVEMKVKAIKEDASHVTASCWRSPLEISFLWIGGWRPTMGVILVFSLMGMQIENDLVKILEGIEIPAMAALSGKQLQKLNFLQQQNRRAEDDLSSRLAELQMSVADQEIARATAVDPPPSESDDLSKLREAMEPKLAGLRDIVLEAEQLRSRTVQELINILTPLQSVQYAIAAMELIIAVRKLGGSQHESQSIRELASGGNVKDLQKALQRGADPSEPDYDGRMALHLAASKGHIECVEVLVNAGAHVNRKDNSGMTPLLAALRGGHDNVAELLAEQGAETQLEEAGVELCKATASGDIKYVERLVKHGVDPNTSDYARNTPLHIAAAVGRTEAVELLVNEGADVLAKDRHGHTPLDEARDAQSEAAVKIIEDEIARRQESEESSGSSNDANPRLNHNWTKEKIKDSRAVRKASMSSVAMEDAELDEGIGPMLVLAMVCCLEKTSSMNQICSLVFQADDSIEHQYADSSNGSEDGRLDTEEEAVCRICLLELSDGRKSMKMDCLCKGELALAHTDCAVKWFSIRGSNSCDICSRDVGNLPLLHRPCSPFLQIGQLYDGEEEFARSWHKMVAEFLRSALASFWHKLEELSEFP